MKTYVRQGIGAVLCAVTALYQPGAVAQPAASSDTAPDAERSLLPNLAELAPEDRARADALLDQALPFIIAADFDRSFPLVRQALEIYDEAWPKSLGSTRPLISELALRKAALALGPELADEARTMARYALALDFDHERDETFNTFDAYDTDPVTDLAIVLLRTGQGDSARRTFRLLLQAPNVILREAAAQALLNEVERLKTAGDKQAAEAAAAFAVATADVHQFAKHRLLAELFAARARLLLERGADEEAIDILVSRIATGSPEETYNARQLAEATITERFKQGEGDRAMQLVARLTGASISSLNLGAADLLGRIATQMPTAEGQLALQERVLAVHERLSGPRGTDDLRLWTAVQAVAHSYLELDRLDEAERMFRRSLDLIQRTGGANAVGTISDSQALASILRRLERPEEAEALLRRVKAIAESESGGDPLDDDVRAITIDLADTLIAQGKLSEADKLTAELIRRIGGATGPTKPDLAIDHLARGRVLLRLGQAEEAVARAQYALGLLPPQPQAKPGEIPDIDFYGGVRHEAFELVATALEAKGGFGEAESMRRRRFEGFSLEGTQAAGALRAGADLATNLSHLGRAEEADALFARVAEATRRVFGASSDLYAYVNRQQALHALRQRNPAKALDPARAALNAEAALERGINASAGEAAYLARARRQRAAGWLFARAAVSTRSSVAPAELFQALQRAEITAAGAALARRAANEAAIAAGAGREVAAWQAARSDLAGLDARIANLAAKGGEGDAERLRRLAEREGLEARVKQAEGALVSRHPRFFDLLSARPVPLSDLQGESGLLRANEALIVMAPGSSELPDPFTNGLVMVITRESSTWAEIALPSKTLEADVYRLHQELAAPGTGETDAPGQSAPAVRFSRARAHQLYQALFSEPRIAALLKAKERWTIAPQGSLISLPFAALVTSPPPGGPERDADPASLRATSWLGLERTLAVVPSVPSIAIQRRSPPTGSPEDRAPFFGLGDPAFRGVADPPVIEVAKTDNESVSRAPRALSAYFRSGTADLNALATLDRLSGTAIEIQQLAQALQAGPDAVVLQLDATEAELRRRSGAGLLKRAEVVAFATHGLVGGELTSGVAEPALALTPPALKSTDRIDPSNDGLLTASEAATLDLSARWLILSACNTAAAGSANAESLSGLARAFLYAGARALLASHFPIFDAAAPHLTGAAVQLGKERGLDPPAAMRIAMQRLAADPSNDALGYSFAHPKAWAAFAVIDAN